MTSLSGANSIATTLTELQVTDIFACQNDSTESLLQTLAQNKNFRLILAHQEQAAVHMADGYARTTGKLGIVIVPSGSGVTNAVTGLATAALDSVPVLCLSAQVKVSQVGLDADREVDALGITRPCTKHNFLVKDPNQIAATLHKAAIIAMSGRPGPVLVDLPIDVIDGNVSASEPIASKLRGYNPVTQGHLGQIRKAIELLFSEKHPIVYAGGGVMIGGASQELKNFAEALGIPVTTTLMGLGAFPNNHPLALGRLDSHNPAAKAAIHGADLVIAIGARFDDRVTDALQDFNASCKIVHIDIDPSSISKRLRTEIPIVGDVKNVINQLTDLLTETPTEVIAAKKNIAPWSSRVTEVFRQQNAIQIKSDLTPGLLLSTLQKIAVRCPILCCAPGSAQDWAARHAIIDRPQSWCTPGGLGTAGYALPAAMGAQVGNPKELTLCLADPEDLLRQLPELITIVENKLPIKIIVAHDNQSPAKPDMGTLAQSFNIKAHHVHHTQDLAPTLTVALKSAEPALIEVHLTGAKL